MPEGRDRIERPVDYAAIFSNRRSNGILLDEAQRLLGSSPVERLILPTDSQVNVGGGNFSSWRPGNGSRGQRLPRGRENTTPVVTGTRGRGRASASVLPSWYPRTPLRDITHIVRAIERRRGAGVGVGGDGLEIQTPTNQQVAVLESPVSLSGRDNCPMVTPGPSVRLKRSCPPSTAKVHQMLLDISEEISEEEADAGFITPQKKLLNSIDKVERIVMEEIQKMQATPQAKREERVKKVRTLMSMR